jgi:hypothetical protein
MTSEHRPVDETANQLTHGLGLVLSVVATVVMMWVVAGESARTIAACGVYCLTLILLYGASTLSHSFHNLDRRRLFRTLDQACIYLLIAGSFTPLAVVFLGRGWWWLILVAMWVLAFAGVLLVLRLAARHLAVGAVSTGSTGTAVLVTGRRLLLFDRDDLSEIRPEDAVSARSLARLRDCRQHLSLHRESRLCIPGSLTCDSGTAAKACRFRWGDVDRGRRGVQLCSLFETGRAGGTACVPTGRSAHARVHVSVWPATQQVLANLALSPAGDRHFREMIKQLHRAGVEAILDVV